MLGPARVKDILKNNTNYSAVYTKNDAYKLRIHNAKIHNSNRICHRFY